MHKLVFFVPQSHKESVKEALFAVGAGSQGLYGSCSWECEGTGQFKPLEGANPYLGTPGSLETVREYRVEMLVSDDIIPLCIDALTHNHPYETPAYEFYKVTLNEDGLESHPWV